MNEIFSIAVLMILSSVSLAAQVGSYVYISSAGSAEDGGISVFHLNNESGKLERIATDYTTGMSRYLTLNSSQDKLYSIDTDSIYAFQINTETGKLLLLNQHSMYGHGGCYLSIDSLERFAFVANYGGGQVLSFTLDSNGQIAESADTIQHERTSVDTTRQQKPHPHMAMPSPDGKWLLVPDLGADLTYVYRIDKETGQLDLTQASGFSPAGTGPRHLAFHPNGSMVYVLNEIIGSITRFEFNSESGQMLPLNTITTLPDTSTVYNKCADIHITPNGQYLYASNRGPNTIAIFEIDQDGALESKGWFPSGGKVPRAFGIDPTGKYILIANKDSDNLITFEINYADGSVKMIDKVEVEAPQAVKFLPIGE